MKGNEMKVKSIIVGSTTETFLIVIFVVRDTLGLHSTKLLEEEANMKSTTITMTKTTREGDTVCFVTMKMELYQHSIK
jgi:hypothetical protein